MASPTSMDRPRASSGQHERPSNESIHSNGTISPSLLQNSYGNKGLLKQQPSVTSVPVQETSVRSVTFPKLPSAGNDLDIDNFAAHATTSGLMSNATDGSGFDLSFDDLMTPDYSTDNYISEHTTPQEAIWERDFHQRVTSNESTQPHILDSGSQRSEQEENPTKELHGIYANPEPAQPRYVSSALLSPQLTTPSPPGSTRQKPALPISPRPTMDRSSKKRGAESLQLSTDSTSLHPQSPPQHRPVSPVIMVSSHSHGDSPAHTSPPRHRSLSRPRRGPTREEPDTYTMLMPPDQLDTAGGADSDSRTGIDPAARGPQEVPTINQLAENRQLNERNQEVKEWLSTSNSGSDLGEERVMRQLRLDRPRALSAGVKTDAMGLPEFSDKDIPGPGALIVEDSQDEYTEDESVVDALASESGSEAPESPPVQQMTLDSHRDESSYFPRYDSEEVPPEMQEPLPRQFYKRGPWQDPLTGPIRNDQWQPFSSNAAVVKFNQEAARWETASRAATWGTRRRLSDGEVQSIVDGSRVRHLSLVKRGRARGSTLIKRAKDKANDLIPHRSNSNIKKAAESPPSPEPTQMVESPQPRNSVSSAKPLQRISSFSKNRSPPSEIAAINTSFSNNPQTERNGAESQRVKPESGLRSPLHLLRKARSKSDVGKSNGKSSPGIHELMTQHGGPPVMSIASPTPQPSPRFPRQDPVHEAAVDEEYEEMDDAGIRMDLQVRPENIIPNLEGFKYHVKHLNPRLGPYLIDRIGQEQVRRYKKLLDTRVKHKKAVLNRNCPSIGFCFDLGGEAKLLAPRQSAKDPDATCAQFSVQNPAGDDESNEELEEGVVTPALFPPGIPLPPVRRLPAEFECFLCFKVKKFQKPSDWTKHVHEDVQPFSCTFPNCSEPKSFKRKADWVRHENERHRRLEFWKCDVQECNHICYRKDNFVQHLVREHKKNEPKMKSQSSGKKKGGREDDNDVWKLAESCRHETSTKPRDEPCKFCGNVCSSWKNLSVHMGKHMEQIAMPVLDLVNMKEVTADTIISPVEHNVQQATSSKAFTPKSTTPTLHTLQEFPLAQLGTTHGMSASPALATQHDPSLSPYTRSVHSHHISPSASQSPAVVQASPHVNHLTYNDASYYETSGLNGIQGSLGQSEAYDVAHGYDHSNFAADGMALADQYDQLDTQLNQNYSAVHPMSTPLLGRSMPMTMDATSANNFGLDDSQYKHASNFSSFQSYTPTSQPGNFGTTPGNRDQYNMSHQYGQQNNTYRF